MKKPVPEFILLKAVAGKALTLLKSRSSHQRCSIRKYVLRNFTKFTGKHLCQSVHLFNKGAWVRPVTLLKGDPDTGVFL